MNKRIAAIVLAVLALTVVGGWTAGGIAGSKHDFSNSQWAGGDACGACHVPHREEAPKAAPLWDPSADLSRRFAAPTKSDDGPGRGTLMCIRCHDGTIARDTFLGDPRERFKNKRNPALLAAGHGTTDHPVGIKYPSIDRGFRPITQVEAKGAVRLPDGKVECVSCHDPHNTLGLANFLVTSNARSALCLTCHNK